MRNLILRLNGVYPIDDVITELLQNRLQEKLFGEGEFLAREGQVCRRRFSPGMTVFFLVSGGIS